MSCLIDFSIYRLFLSCGVSRILCAPLWSWRHFPAPLYPPDGEWNKPSLALPGSAAHQQNKQLYLKKTAGSFLKQKYQTGDPVRQYAAFRIWEGYLAAREYRNRNAACGRFIESVSPFTLAFQTNTAADFEKRTGRPAPSDPSHRLPPQLLPEDTKLALWYPDQRMGMECACAYESF